MSNLHRNISFSIYGFNGSGKSSRDNFEPTRPGMEPSGICNDDLSSFFNIHDFSCFPCFCEDGIRAAWLLTSFALFLELLDGVCITKAI